MRNNVILIGYMGCGKSTIGRSISQKFQWTFLDTDEWIEGKEGITIKEIFASKGEAYFRDLETLCLKELLREFGEEAKEQENKIDGELKKNEGMVISVGGGLPVREENQRLLRELGTVIYLNANPDTIYERVKADTTRPLLQTENPRQKIKDMLAIREEKYQSAADFVIKVDGKSVSQVVEEIENRRIKMWKE